MAKSSKTWYLFFITGTAALGGFLFGFDTAVISGTIPFVTVQFDMDAIIEGWFVSSALVGCIVGVSIAGKTSDTFGRKKLLILSAFLFSISAFSCMIAGTSFFLFIYRIIGGVGVGIASLLSPLYISEISPPRIRGKLVALYQLAITLGILVAYFSNSGLQNMSDGYESGIDFIQWIIGKEVWRSMFGTELIPAVLFLILVSFIPESPRWLIAVNKKESAKEIMIKIGGKKNADRQLKEIEKVLNSESGSIKELLKPGLRIALIIGVVLAITSQFSGINAIIYYGPKILNQAGFTISDALGGQVTIGLVNVVFTCVAMFTIDRFGRRRLLIIGGSGAVLSLIATGIMFRIGITTGIVVLLPILLFISCFAFSFGPVVWVILSEIYPTKIRGRAISIATLSLWLANAIVGQLVPWLLESFGPAVTFWLFALLCSPAIIVAIKWLPETKNQSLEEIELFWKKRKFYLKK